MVEASCPNEESFRVFVVSKFSQEVLLLAQRFEIPPRNLALWFHFHFVSTTTILWCHSVPTSPFLEDCWVIQLENHS